MPNDQDDLTPPAPPPTRAATPEPELDIDTPGAWYAPAEAPAEPPVAVAPQVSNGSGWVSWVDFIETKRDTGRAR